VSETLAALAFQQFDTDAFEISFHRVTDARAPDLEREVAALVAKPPVILDAKLPAEDIAGSTRLLKLGFRKICTQIGLSHDLRGTIGAPTRSTIEARIELPEDSIRAHAHQFTFDRFSLDPEIPVAGHDRLYSRWMKNSLTGEACLVAVCGHNFITFKDTPDGVKSDLTSVLDSGQGIASDLLTAILRHARDRNARLVEVVTECENRPAWRLYLKAGFMPAAFVSVFHCVRA